MTKTALNISLLSLFILVLVSCSSTKKVTVSGEAETPSPRYDESFDPLSLNDEDIEFPEEEARVPEETSPSTEIQFPQPQQEENRLVDGFRVQLLATKDIESATIEKKEAEFAFAEDSLNIYIEFDSPYYKVRLGDFKTREEAENFRNIAVEKGYTASWIVKTKVWSNPPLPVMEESEDQQ